MDGDGITPNTVALHPCRGEAPESLCPEQGHTRAAYVFLTGTQVTSTLGFTSTHTLRVLGEEALPIE